MACTLGPGDAAARVAEWRDLVGRHVELVERSAAGARLRLAPGDEALLAAVDLAERERACCGFFTFSLRLEDAGRVLAIAVPPEAASSLTALIGAGGG